ncbi:efflux RND transporter periplasmic adaptor subunit [Chitinimonas lacunae]|uniref:Efflux RND transporter periplasmic adaptor subunit n=1 Tax=Chitinimonas lacunae TaxID=1963018 RepID=A0ABV8MV94_9NEIS
MASRLAVWLGGGALAAVVAYAALKPAQQPAEGPGGRGERPQLVTTVISRSEDVPLRITAQGNVVALQQVELRPQIASTVRQIHVREGLDVKAGQTLFTLDSRAEAARTSQSAAQLARDRAQLADAERNLARTRELHRQAFVSQSAVDSAAATVDSLRASVAASNAALQGSQVELGYQTIKAPFAGRIGAIDVHRGSLVQPGMAEPLVRLTQLDPIGVAFTLPERELRRLLTAQAAGPVKAEVELDDGQKLSGQVNFIDNAIDASGTIRVKAEFANKERRLWPGLFARVTVDLGMERGVVVLPTGALQTGPEGQFVYLVDAAQQVSARPVRLVRIVSRDDRQFAVVDGLEAGRKVVAEGGQNLRPGAKVSEGGPRGGGGGRGNGQRSDAQRGDAQRGDVSRPASQPAAPTS